MKILIVPDKFKGSLNANEVAEAIKEGILNSSVTPVPNIEIQAMADGGDGSLEVIEKCLSLQTKEVETFDPIGRKIRTQYLYNQNQAFIELASASGYVLLKENEKNPLVTSTYGTGLIILDAINSGKTEIYLFIGGSATNDAGIGILQALGFEFKNKDNQGLEPIGKNLIHIDQIVEPPLQKLKEIKFQLLCDVENPLYGNNGAAHVYARQKGADDNAIRLLDQGLENFSNYIKKHKGINLQDLKGSGAAGGVPGGLFSFLNCNLVPGAETLIKLTNLEQKIKDSDIVISGEGRLDHQSLQGKLINAILNYSSKHNKPLILIVGENSLPDSSHYTAYAIKDMALNFEDAVNNAYGYIVKLSQRAIQDFSKRH